MTARFIPKAHDKETAWIRVVEPVTLNCCLRTTISLVSHGWSGEYRAFVAEEFVKNNNDGSPI